MKYLAKFVLITSIVAMPFSCNKEAELFLVSIPDLNFLGALIDLGVDTNGDGNISYSEAEEVKDLYIDGYNISDLSGIEKFVNLELLDCSDNQLIVLDVSLNPDLEYLNVYRNKLTNLEVLELTNLIWLDCDNNLLTELDISSNLSFIGLSCDHNQLIDLDVSNQLYLEHLECGHNQLNSLDISKNTKLGRAGYLSLVIDNMPSLQKVCVWTMPFPPEGLEISTEGSPNIYFTTDCTN